MLHANNTQELYRCGQNVQLLNFFQKANPSETRAVGFVGAACQRCHHQ